MEQRPRLLMLVHVDSVTRLIFSLLLASLLLVADGYVLIIVSRYLGIYLLLAVEAATGLLAVLAILSSYRHTVSEVREAVRANRYPVAEFRSLASLWVGSICLIVPGFVTDVIGLAAMIPPLRWLAGYVIERSVRTRFEELYEYLKLEE